MDKKQIIISLRNKRYTYKVIGNLLGISSQRVHQIIKRKSRQLPMEKLKILTSRKRKFFGISDEKIDESGRNFPRELIRIRDNHTCQICGKVWQKGQRKFDVHHKDFNKEKTKKYDNFIKEKDNMITFCHKCHLNLEKHKLAMVK